MKQKNARPQKVTLADVSRQAGVSVATASMVMTGRPNARIPTITADRVILAARELDYQRPVRFYAQDTNRLPLIGLITDTVASDRFVGEFVFGANTRAADRGHGLLIAETGRDSELEKALVQVLTSSGVSLFVYATMSTRQVQVPTSLQQARLVLLNCVDPMLKVQSILPDDETGATEAIAHLFAKGRTTRVWLVGEAEGETFAGAARLSGIMRALASHDLSLDRHISCRWWPPQARAAMSEALQQGRPTAVIAMNDRIAMGVYQAAAEAGICIPEDIAVLSFDNSDLAWWLSPGLTSVALPYQEMGSRAIDAVLDGKPDSATVLVPMPLHVRHSS